MKKNKHNKLIFTFSLIALLLSLTLFIIYNGKSSQSRKSHIVVLKEDGFSPSKIVIFKGETVIFKTDRNESFWPASNLHPTHEIYPEFDPQQPIEKDKSWSFQFKKTGTFKYHDHLAPYYRGEIRVQSAPTQSGLKSCDNENFGQDEACSERLIREIVRRGKVNEAFDMLATYYSNQTSPSQFCHALTHAIGEETYELFSRNISFMLSPKTAYCAYGFYHGFMENLVAKTKDLNMASKFCDYADKQLKASASDAKLQCYHGIGHGTATSHDPTIFGNESLILKPALDLCEKVSKKEDELYRCSSGAFNAIAIYYMSGEYGLPLDKTDPLRLCRQQKDVYKEPCYGNMNTLLKWLTKSDFSKAVLFINVMQEDNYSVASIQYLSAAFATEYIKKTDSMVNTCRSLQEKLQLPCVTGILHGIIEHGKPGIEYIDGLNFCRSKILTSDERSSCFNHAIGYFQTIYPKDKVSTVCQSIESTYQQYCKRKNI